MEDSPELLEIKAHTGLHVVKGAVRKVLGTKWTAGVKVKGAKGTLTVQADRAPSLEEQQEIQKLVDDKIAEDAEILVHELDRSEAEQRWGDEIYDLFPLPPSITRLFVLEIPGWNLNCCREKHLERTGQYQSLQIERYKFRENKGLLETTFSVA